MVLSKLIKEYKEMCLEDVTVEEVLEDLQKLEDIYKPKDVPQFVADWYEEHKDDFEFNIWDWIAFRDEPKKAGNRKFNDWLNKGVHNPIQTLVKMHLFGYTVKEVKRYIVRVKNTSKNSNCLNFYEYKNLWIFADDKGVPDYRVKHTKKELENAGFSWVFNCPCIEIEEVEE